MKNILVCGGAGFLGSNLCKELVKNIHNYVCCLDNFYTGKLKNIESIINYSNFEVVSADIIDVDLENLHIEFDEIYNAACPASPPAYQAEPIFTTKTSVFGILNILEYAKEHNCKVVQFSTSEVYGNPLEHPQSEKYLGNVNPIGIRSCYDEGKRCAESICFDYLRRYGTDVRVVRIFNTYGPYMYKDDGRVISNFIVQALNGKPLTIYGDGTQTRSFCYVDDLISGIIKLMALKQNPKMPINLGNPNEFTLLELCDIIDQKLGPIEKEFLPLPKDDPCKRRPDITNAKCILNWEPKIQLREGLDKTIEYYKGELHK